MSFKVLMAWLIAFLTPLITYISLGDALMQESRLFISILSAGTVLWIFNVFPDFVPALIILTSTLALGLFPPDIILSGFSSNTFFLILGIMGLGILVSSSGIFYRGILLILRYLPSGSGWYNAALFFVGALMTPLVPSVMNRAKLMGPLSEDFISLSGLKSEKNNCTKASASAFYGATLLSSVFLTGSIMNLVILGLLPFQDHHFITSVGWIAGSSVTGVILLIMHFVGSSIFFISKQKIEFPKERVEQQLKIIGQLKIEELSAIGTVVLFLLALITMPYHKILLYCLSLFALFSLLSLRLVSHKQWLSQTDWSFLIFLGCVIGIFSTLRQLNIDSLIAVALVPGIKAVTGLESITAIFSLLVILTLIVRLFLPIGPTVIIMMILSIPIADAFGLSLWSLGFTIVMVCDIWFLPYQSPFYIRYAESFLGGVPYDEKKFLVYNALINFARLVALYLSLPYWKSLGLI